MDIIAIKQRILAGGSVTAEEAYSLIDPCQCAPEALREAAAEVTRAFSPRTFDSCSIVNARSGRCPEDCKWCAQSAHYSTGADSYPVVDHDTCMRLADHNRAMGIGRYSLVTSGRALSGRPFETILGYFRELAATGGMGLCASMGLLTTDQMRQLRLAGVTRYHCNLETAPSHFPTLCSTHTIADKIKAMEAASEAGLEICSGGIIGMGETMRQRVEFALELRRVKPVSIPINILCPIPGTPLESQPPLSDDEILDTVAVFRLIHPHAVLRFAGGRMRINPDTQRRALRIGINGAIMGDLLTTIGSQIRQDMQMARECGYETPSHDDSI